MKPAGGRTNRVARGILVGYSGFPDMLKYLMPDNGLASLAGALLSAGHFVKVLDFETIEFARNSCKGKVSDLISQVNSLQQKGSTVEDTLVKVLRNLERSACQRQKELQYHMYEDIVRKIHSENINFVGFKLWDGTGYKASIRIAEWIKTACPNVRLFAGGPQADIYLEGLIKQTKVFDAIAFGEGEETMVGLAEFAINQRRLEDIPNIVYWDGSDVHRTPRQWIEDLNELPFPCYDEEVYPAMRDNNKVKVIPLDESRGCPNACKFCIHPIKSGSKLRKKSGFRLRCEIEYLRSRYGSSCFRYAGSRPSLTVLGNEDLDLDRLRSGNILYSAYFHAGDVGHTNLSKAKDQGCYAVFIGLESANPKQLKEVYGKNATIKQMEQAICGAKQAGIYTVVSIIFPGPGENSKTRKDTLNFLIETQPHSVLVISPGIIPGTEWYRNYQKYGFVFNSEDFLAKMMESERPHFVPSTFWMYPQSFTLNGKDHEARAQEAEEFSAELRNHGIATGVTDDDALLAYLAGYRGSESRFVSKVKMAFLTGRTEILGSMVQRINDSVSRIAKGCEAPLTKIGTPHKITK